MYDFSDLFKMVKTNFAKKEDDQDRLPKHPGAHSLDSEAPLADLNEVEIAIKKERLENSRGKSDIVLFLCQLMITIGMFCFFPTVSDDYINWGVIMVLCYGLIATVCTPMCSKNFDKDKPAAYVSLVIFQVSEAILLVAIANEWKTKFWACVSGPAIGVGLGAAIGIYHRKSGAPLILIIAILSAITILFFLGALFYGRYVTEHASAAAFLALMFTVKTIICITPPKCKV